MCSSDLRIALGDGASKKDLRENHRVGGDRMEAVGIVVVRHVVVSRGLRRALVLVRAGGRLHLPATAIDGQSHLALRLA